MERTAYVHVGTHKTGTTSIQAMLALNEHVFAQAGVFVPRAGRTDNTIAAHHNIAFELCQSHRFDARHGTLAETFHEVAANGAPIICLSSEEFEACGSNKGGLRRIVYGLRSIGYRTRILLYLRPQVDAIESVFGEMIRGGWQIDFGSYVEEIVRTGLYWDSRFDYCRLVEAFAEVCGGDIEIRPFDAFEPPESLLKSFARTIGQQRLDTDRLVLPEKLNQIRGRPSLNPVQIARVITSFSPSNARLAKRHGVKISAISSQRLALEAKRGLRQFVRAVPRHSEVPSSQSALA